MSWIARLLGRAPAVEATRVLVPDDVAAALTEGGTPLQQAVDEALRAYLAARDAEAARVAAGHEGRVPFWLARDAEGGAGIEDQLRGRLAQRRASEEEDEAARKSRARAPRDDAGAG